MSIKGNQRSFRGDIWFNRKIDQRVRLALREKEAAFFQEHSHDTDRQLLEYVQHTELFQKRFSEGLSVRKTAEAMHLNRGAVERRQAAFYEAFSLLLRQRDEADGILRITPNVPAISIRDEDE